MKLINKLILLLSIILLIGVYAYTQLAYPLAYQLPVQTYSAISTPATGFYVGSSGATYEVMTWSIVGGTLSACTLSADTSINNSSWSVGGLITGQTCTSGGSVTVNITGISYVRLNLSTYTVNSGTPVITVTLTGMMVNPAGSGALTSLSGTVQGQALIGGVSGGLNGGAGGPLYTGPFGVNGTFPSATDPCNAINLVVGISPAHGAEVNADALAPTTGTPCTYATANILGTGQTGAGSLANGGHIHLGGYTLWVPFAPSQYGCVNSTCTNGPFPPRGIIVVPNKHKGIEGIGRGDFNGVNTTIAVCAHTHTPAVCNSTSTNYEVTRAWGVSVGSTITTSVPAIGSCFALVAPFSGHRCYMEVLTAGNSFTATCTAPVGGIVTCTVNSNAAPFNNNLSGVLSAGQSITFGGAFTVLTGALIVGDGSGSTVYPTTNSSGQTVFTVATALTCGVCTGTITVGFNILGGEHVLISGSSVLNNNFNWRVCQKTTGGTFPSIGVQNDTNCPANPNASAFYVVGTSNDQLYDNSGATLSTSCAASCGTLYAEIPIIDYGSNPGNFQFGMFLKSLALSCNTVPSCTTFRSMTANEESGMQTVLMNGSSMWCGDWWTNNAQDANNWDDIECIGGTSFTTGTPLSNVSIGTTGFIVSESAMRAMRGATVNYNSVGAPANTGNYGSVLQGTIPGCGFELENTTGTLLMDFHAEGFQFNRCYGIELPSQGYVGVDNGGQSINSCGNQTSGVGGGCAVADGPFTTPLVTSVAPGAVGQTTLTFASPPTNCIWNPNIPNANGASGLGMLVELEAIGNNHGVCNTITGLGTNCPEVVTMTGPIAGNTIPVSATQNIHNVAATPVYCSWSSAEMISGNFPLAIGGGQSGPWTGDIKWSGTKKNTGAQLSAIDDYTGKISSDNQIMDYNVDSALSGGSVQRTSSSGVVETKIPALIISGNIFTSSGGCTEGTLVGGSTSGKFTTSGSVSCTTIITMGGGMIAPHGWSCTTIDLTTIGDVTDPHQTASTTTTATIATGTIVAGDVIQFSCVGY